MKCKKCAGELPHGTYGKVKCEYCDTINNVPTPEQEREKKVEVREATGRKWVTAAVVIVILGIVGSVAAFVPLVSVQESYTTTETQYKTVSYQEQEPYADTITTYKEVPYEDEECEWAYPKYDFEWGGWGETGYYGSINVILTNGEDQSITISPLTIAFISSNEESYGQEIDRITKSITLTPYQQRTINFQWNFKRGDYGGTASVIESESQEIEKCKTVTKFKKVPETQTVTKYKTVTKTKKVPEQVRVAKTRTVEKTLLEYLLS